MITGWKNIKEATGFSRKTIKRLAENESFPLVYIAGRPTTAPGLIEEWLRSRVGGPRVL